MNILHVTPYFVPAYAFGGVVRAAEGLTRALAARGHAVTVLTTDALAPSQRLVAGDEVMQGVRVVRVPNWIARGTFNLSTPRGLGMAARPLIEQADVVHCHEFRTVENLLVTPIAESLHKPLLLSPHGTLTLDTGRSQVKSAWDRLLSQRVARRFDQLVGLTQDEADEAQAYWRQFGTPTKPIGFSVIPNGVDPDEFAHPGGRDAFRQQYALGDGPVCLFMARLHPRKGPQLLAQAFRAIPLPNARLVIAGPDEGALALLRPYLDSRAVVTGYLAAEARLAALAAADLFVLPAVGEGMPMGVLEAMAAGLPVIVSPGCHLPEVAQAGAGLEVAAEPTALAAALSRLLSNTDERTSMGAAAHKLVRDRFTWDTIAAQYEAIYTRLVTDSRP